MDQPSDDANSNTSTSSTSTRRAPETKGRTKSGAPKPVQVLVNLLVLAGIFAGAYGLCLLLEPRVNPKGSHPCEEAKSVTNSSGTKDRKAQKLPASHGKKATLSVAQNTSTSFNLGRDINSGVRSIPFTLSKPLPAGARLRVQPGMFTPEEQDGRPLGMSVVQTWAVVDRSGTRGTAYVCISPKDRKLAPWGAFTGTLVFADSRIAPKTLPVTITSSYPKGNVVAMVGLIVCLVVSFYVYFLRGDTAQGQQNGDEALRWPFAFVMRYWRYNTQMIGVLTIAAGLVTASAAFTAQYLRADVWSGQVTDWLTFCGAVGTSFIAGGTAGRLAGNRYTSTSNDSRTAAEPRAGT